MDNVLNLVNTLNVVAIQQQIDDRRKKLEERDIELFVLRRILEAARAAQFGIPSEDLRMGWQGWKIAPETEHSAKKTANVQIDGNKFTYTTDLHHKMKSFLNACEDAGVTTVHIRIEVKPDAGDVNSETKASERTPHDTSEEDVAAEVEALFADAALSEVTQSAESVTTDIAEEIAVPPAEVVTPPTSTPTPEPAITKPRALSPDARNQQLSICDRAKIYLEFAYNATAMAIGKGIDLPDPTCMVKHLQKDSRFVKDPRGFWKLVGT